VKYAQKILKFSASRKADLISTFLLRSMGANISDFFFPQDLKRKASRTINYEVGDVANATLDLTHKSSTYLKSWQVSEALQDLIEEDLLLNVRGKKNIKKIAPKTLPKLKKGGDSTNVKREGLPSVYHITSDFVAIKKIVSKPEALEIIHCKLKEYGLLERFYHFMGMAVVYAIRDGDERMLQYANIVVQNMRDNSPVVQALSIKAGLNSNASVWKLIKEYLCSIKEEELERFVKKMVRLYIENPIDYSYTLLAVSRL
jgi:hypothetical protein